MTVTEDLTIIIESLNANANKYDMCSWHRVHIKCSSNDITIDIFNIKITSALSTQISNSEDDLSCDITLYTRDGLAISRMRYERKIPKNVSSKIQIEC